MNVKICYLCGNEIIGKSSKDHIPPKQFYFSEFRKHVEFKNLITLPTHQECNYNCQEDENYFVTSLSPLVGDKLIYKGVEIHLKDMLKHKKGYELIKKSYREFSDKIGNIYLPSNLVCKEYDIKKVNNVVWKIFRGLYFHKYNIYINVNTKNNVTRLLKITETLPKEVVEFFNSSNEKFEGICPKIFDYKIDKAFNMAFGLLIFWNSFGFVIFAHLPGCFCDKCNNVAGVINHAPTV
jgi:hypothetical protein